MIKDWVKGILLSLPETDAGDRLYSSIIFRHAHRRKPKQSSGLFNDYLFFRKISNSSYDPLIQYTSDKIYVKDYIRSILGDGYCPRTLAVYHSTGEMTETEVPTPSIVKPAHSSGLVVFLKEGGQRPSASEFQELEAALSSSPYETAREKNYRYLPRRLQCEELLSSAENTKDYKVFCYAGQPRLIQVDSDRHTRHKRNVYDTFWNRLDVQYNHPVGVWESAPKQLSEMLKLAERLAVHFESVRVDFYIANDRLYIGELTHCPESAHGRFDSVDSERRFSDIYFRRT